MAARLVQDLKPYQAVPCVRGETPIVETAKMFAERPGLRYLCVTGPGGELSGLVSRKRLFRAIFTHHVPASHMLHELYTLLTSDVSQDIMIQNAVSVRETTPVDTCIRIMIQHDLSELPVLDDQGRVLGLLTTVHILRAWLDGEL